MYILSEIFSFTKYVFLVGKYMNLFCWTCYCHYNNNAAILAACLLVKAMSYSELIIMDWVGVKDVYCGFILSWSNALRQPRALAVAHRLRSTALFLWIKVSAGARPRIAALVRWFIHSPSGGAQPSNRHKPTPTRRASTERSSSWLASIYTATVE